ncbi:MAG: hypothetical protein HY673_08095 [Chloroflexi bacterium]|nr:hypothetical protein [Chloroflexota bacterium]
MAPPAPPPSPPAPPAKTAATVSLPVVNLKSDARDPAGNFVPPTPGQKIVIAPVDGVLTLVMPVSVPRDTTLKTFTDPVSGVAFADNRLTIPVRDAEGNLQLTITVMTDMPLGQGSAAIAKVGSVEMQTPEVGSDFSKSDPRVGRVSAFVRAVLRSFPESAAVEVDVTGNPDAAVQASVSQLAARLGKKLLDTAFSMRVSHGGSSNKPDVSTATVSMTAASGWAGDFGPGQISIARTDDTGDSELLPTRLATDREGRTVFEAVSPKGFAVFTLVALQSTPAPAATPAGTPAATLAATPLVGRKPVQTLSPSPRPSAVASVPRPTPKPYLAASAPSGPLAAPRPPVDRLEAGSGGASRSPASALPESAAGASQLDERTDDSGYLPEQAEGFDAGPPAGRPGPAVSPAVNWAVIAGMLGLLSGILAAVWWLFFKTPE